MTLFSIGAVAGTRSWDHSFGLMGFLRECDHVGVASLCEVKKMALGNRLIHYLLLSCLYNGFNDSDFVKCYDCSFRLCVPHCSSARSVK